MVLMVQEPCGSSLAKTPFYGAEASGGSVAQSGFRMDVNEPRWGECPSFSWNPLLKMSALQRSEGAATFFTGSIVVVSRRSRTA